MADVKSYNYGTAISYDDNVISSLPSKRVYEKAHEIYSDMLRDENLSMMEAYKIADLLKQFFVMDGLA